MVIFSKSAASETLSGRGVYIEIPIRLLLLVLLVVDIPRLTQLKSIDSPLVIPVDEAYLDCLRGDYMVALMEVVYRPA